MKKWKLLLLALAGGFAALQLFNPGRENPPVKNDFIAAAQPPPPVAASLRAACYDCHSRETRWPLYARIAPVSWLVASDVNEGREHLDFSDWPTDPAQAAKRLDRINEVVDYQEMPLKKYILLHADARLSAAQRKEILDWTDAAAGKLRVTATNN
ncbi:MAG TPA: heme-binding domain-containing protein [Verrucomicrobiae bacterium]